MSAQQVGVNLAARGDQAGSDFYDDSHAMKTFTASVEMVSHLALEEDSRLFSYITEVARA